MNTFRQITPNEPGQAMCVYCWPKLIVSTRWSREGLPACAKCGGDPNRRCQVPRFMLHEVEWSLPRAA